MVKDVVLTVCPTCDQPMQAPGFALGREGLCPYCNALVVVRDQEGQLQCVYFDPTVTSDRHIDCTGTILFMSILEMGWSGRPVKVDRAVIKQFAKDRRASENTIKRCILKLVERGYLIMDPAISSGLPKRPFFIQVCKPFSQIKPLNPQRIA